jgi:acetyltransferase-like isoleucine patch superfamily enzyme
VSDWLKAFGEDFESALQEVLGQRADSERNRALRKGILRQFLAQLLVDDERAALHGLPAGCRMRENAKILNPEKLVCGEQVWIGEGAYIDASGGLTIGAHTTIGVGVYVWTHTSILANLLMQNVPGGALVSRQPSRIGAGCYIVGPSVINPGVTIGDRVAVLPMSVVTKDVPDNKIVCGAPAQVVGEVDEAFIKRLRAQLAAGTPG